MPSTPINEQITQLFTFALQPFLLKDSRKFEPTKAISRNLRKLDYHPGWTQINWGRDFNNNDVQVYITWLDSSHAHSFLASPGFETVFSPIALPPISLKSVINLTGTISNQHPTEAITFYFPLSMLDESNKRLFEQQLQSAISEMQSLNGQEIHIVSLAKGWGVGTTTPLLRDGVEAGYYVAMIAWSGLEGMLDVKRDAESVFNNMFAPLKILATLGTEAALYARLRAKEEEEGRMCFCVVQ